MASSGRHPGTNTDTGKVRILLQTVTHLVPGNDREGKLHFIRNLTARRQWKRLFDWDQERMWPYHDDFGLDNIKCFFLIDHRGHNHDTTDDQQALVLWYRWTGDFLIRVDEEFSAKMQKELRKWPFMWEGRKFHETPTGPGGKFTQIQQRDFIKSKLVLGETIHESDCNF